MAVKKVSISRAQWLFSGQCIPGGARTDTINGAAAQRCKLLNIPPCVAIAISPKSEVRGITVGPPGAAWPAGTIDLIEGSPQIFSWPGGLVDLVKLDWQDGRLEIEYAETPEDVANLSVFTSSISSIMVESYDATLAALVVHQQPPRNSGGLCALNGIARSVGGLGATIVTRLAQPLAPDQLSLSAPFGGGTSLGSTGAITAAAVAMTQTASINWMNRRTVIIYGWAVNASAITAQFVARAQA